MVAALFVIAGLLTLSPSPVSAEDLECTIVGTEGDDTLLGTSGDDVICGLGGGDAIAGGGGNDVIHGGPGNDEISGGGGNDVVHGGDGADGLEGGSGNDQIWGERGNDTITGGSGDDVIRGGDGQDTANGGSGVDACEAETQISCEDDLPPELIVTWSPATLEIDRAAGSSQTAQVALTIDADVTGAQLEVTGDVSGFVSVLQGEDPYPLPANGMNQVVLAFDVPSGSLEQAYAGQMHLVADGTSVSPPLDLVVNVVPQTPTPPDSPHHLGAAFSARKAETHTSMAS